MHFFQRLAPGVRMQHAVQPVLPPRFAGLGAGLREGEADAASPPPERATTIPLAPEPEPRPLPAAANAAGADVVQAAPGEAGRPAVPATTRVEGGATQSPVDRPLPPRPLPASARQPAPPPVAAPPVPRPSRVHQPSPGPDLETAPPSGPQSHGAVAGHAPQRPLSALALAQRVQPPNNDVPIVHVTIERIEVRAPAPAQAPRPQARPRPAPTMSLADYLRRGRS